MSSSIIQPFGILGGLPAPSLPITTNLIWHVNETGHTLDVLDRVLQWDDQVASKDLIADVAGTIPILLANEQNGLPAVDFDGTNDRLFNASGLITGGATRTILSIVKPEAVGAGVFPWFHDGNRDTGNARAYSLSPETNVDIVGSNRIWANATPQGFYYLVTYQQTTSNIGQCVLRVDGAVATVTFPGAAVCNTDPTGRLALGATYGTINGFLNFFNGKVGEVVVHSPALSAGELVTQENFLISKWAI